MSGITSFNSVEQRLNMSLLETADCVIDAGDKAKYTCTGIILTLVELVIERLIQGEAENF